jgi:hypothetical protein
MKLPQPKGQSPKCCQLFDETKVQGVRLLFTDGAVGTFYGPLQLDTAIINRDSVTVEDVEVFYPLDLPEGQQWMPIVTMEPIDEIGGENELQPRGNRRPGPNSN